MTDWRRFVISTILIIPSKELMVLRHEYGLIMAHPQTIQPTNFPCTTAATAAAWSVDPRSFIHIWHWGHSTVINVLLVLLFVVGWSILYVLELWCCVTSSNTIHETVLESATISPRGLPVPEQQGLTTGNCQLVEFKTTIINCRVNVANRVYDEAQLDRISTSSEEQQQQRAAKLTYKYKEFSGR